MNTEMKTTHKATLWAWLLLAVLCCASPEATARKARTFSRPAWVGSTTSTIRNTKVELSRTLLRLSVSTSDTSRVGGFKCPRIPGFWEMTIGSIKPCGGEGIVLGEHYVTPPSGEGEFKVLFEPMPRKTRFFDFIEGNMQGAFNIYGVHEEGKAPAGA